MKVQEFLSQALEIDKKITAEREQLAALRASAERCTSNLSAVPSGHSTESRPPERLAIAIADLESKIQAAPLALAEAEQEIVAAIYRLDDVFKTSILKMHYIDGMSFEEIAGEMNYNPRYIRREHKKILNEIAID